MKERRRTIRPRNLRKITTRVIVFLLLSAIVNVAVAWGCVFRGEWTLPEDCDVPSSGLKDLKRAAPSHWIMDSNCSFRLRLFGATVDCIGGDFPVSESTQPNEMQKFHGAMSAGMKIPAQHARRLVAGWPLRSLEYTAFGGGFMRNGPPFVYRTAVTIANRKFPCGPLWPGFAINTIFYAAILWLLFTARLALPWHRRRRRIKRGLCPACAYPVGVSEVCTECGKPVIGKA